MQNLRKIAYVVMLLGLACSSILTSVSGQVSRDSPNTVKQQGSKALHREKAPAAKLKAQGQAANANKKLPAQEVNYGPAQGCLPPTLPLPTPEGAPIPPLAAGNKPNFIIILTDDQGYDDIGLHQPQQPGGRPTWVNTPNIDKFLRQSTEFDNFYVEPMCSQSRAELLTGRNYVRTGTMLINGGYDYISRDETTSAEYFKNAGYDTSHFGKWHNGRTLGYEPWELGFEESWLPSSHVHLDNLMRHNGRYVQTKGLMEQDLMDKVLGYLKDHESNGKPFYMYYAPHAIHQGFLRPGQGPRWQRPAPEPYKSKYKNMQPPLPGDTAEVWAFLEYMDDVLGRLFDYMDESPLRDNTYIMMMSDNGAELFPTERRGKDKLRRMPSGMQGYKKSVEEGGIRNFLIVKGPGVQAGVVDSTLTEVTDVLPTMADLAGIRAAPRFPWDGISFKDVLLGGGTKAPLSPVRGHELSDAAHDDRFVFVLGPQCWSPDSVPLLGDDRQVIKPQPLLDYYKGGVDGQGFEKCVGVRWKDYKWLGATGKVYRFPGDSHIELPCNEVTGPEATEIAAKLSTAAKNYFTSLMDDPHSFEKPTFQLGLNGWAVTNVLPDGAHERTPGRIQLLPNGASGFSRVGDSVCFAVNVVTGGSYKVSVMYTSQVQASFQLSVGLYANIQAGTAPSLTARLPVLRSMKGKDIGELQLKPSSGKNTEICFTMVSTSSPGTPVFENLANIRFTLKRGAKAWSGETYGIEQEKAEEEPSDKKKPSPRAVAATAAAAAAAAADESPSSKKRTANPVQKGKPKTAKNGMKAVYDRDWVAQDSVLDTWEDLQQQQKIYNHLKQTAAMQQVERDSYQAAAHRIAADKAKESMAVGQQSEEQKAQQHWDKLRMQYLWPQGQGEVMESMFTPYESEGIYTCPECQPELA